MVDHVYARTESSAIDSEQFQRLWLCGNFCRLETVSFLVCINIFVLLGTASLTSHFDVLMCWAAMSFTWYLFRMHRMLWAPALLALLLAIPIIGWILLAFFITTRVIWFIRNLDAVASSVSIVSSIILFTVVTVHPLIAITVTTCVSYVALSFSFRGGYSILSFLDVFFSTPMGLISLGLSSVHATGQLLHLIEGTKQTPILESPQPQKADLALKNPKSTELINSHSRTSPDGIVENNLSYHGPGKIAPNEPVVHVDDYIRTTADGIASNNLSDVHSHDPSLDVPFQSSPPLVAPVQPDSHLFVADFPLTTSNSIIQISTLDDLNRYIFPRPLQDKVTKRLFELDSGELQAVCAGLRIFDRNLFGAIVSPPVVDHKRYIKSLFSELLGFVNEIDFLHEYTKRKVSQESSHRNYEHIVNELLQQLCSKEDSISPNTSRTFVNLISSTIMALSFIFGLMVTLLTIIGLTRLPHGGVSPEYDLSSSVYLRVIELLHLDGFFVEKSYDPFNPINEIVIPSSNLGVPLLFGMSCTGLPLWIRHRKFRIKTQFDTKTKERNKSTSKRIRQKRDAVSS